MSKTQERIRKLLDRKGFIDVGSDVNLEYGGMFVRQSPHGWWDVVSIEEVERTGIMYVFHGDIDPARLPISEIDAALRYADMADETYRPDETDNHARIVWALVNYRGGIDHDPQIFFYDQPTTKRYLDAWDRNTINIKGWGDAALLRAIRGVI